MHICLLAVCAIMPELKSFDRDQVAVKTIYYLSLYGKVFLISVLNCDLIAGDSDCN
jgi:hypothetical protein